MKSQNSSKFYLKIKFPKVDIGLGRIVEYSKTGYWDKEFAEIFN